MKLSSIDDREEHSKKLLLLFQENEEWFKETRQFLNALNLECTPPKQKSSPRKSKSLLLDNPINNCVGTKAGKTCFVVQVGEVENLYKMRKPSVLCKHNLQAPQPLLLDLHQYTLEEALSKRDLCLLKWIDVAMSGLYPRVIPVVIICGGGNQILSEAV